MASKFGLGRGLADINREMGTVPDISILTGNTERVVVRNIPINQIGANPDQPRKTFTETELSELSASIREKGVLQPILLRAVAGHDYLYEIVAGERRWRAAQMAGLTEIPALIKTLTNENAMEIALIENVQRENLNPIEEALAYKNLMEKCGYGIDDVVRLIGKSDSYIRNSMRLISLPDTVREMVSDGRISASHARTIAVADDPESLANEIISNKLSVADVSKRVKNTKRGVGRRAYTSTDIDDDTIRDMTKKISAALSVPVKIRQKRGGAGDVTLSFSTRGMLMELIEKLTK